MKGPRSWVHNIGAATEKALPLADDFQASLGSVAWEDLVGQVDDIGERRSDRTLYVSVKTLNLIPKQTTSKFDVPYPGPLRQWIGTG